MTEREAKQLRYLIHRDAPSLTVSVQQIGNGEWVCVTGATFVWDKDDWERVRNQVDIIVKRIIA